MSSAKRSRLIRPRASKTQEQIDRIGALEKRLAELERRVKDLEPNRLGPPIVPVPFPEPNPFPSDDSSTCPKCGMKWSGVMGYVCPRTDCPMGAGPTIC